uniref:Uncharacterized protein n=1 Tax=Panagrolaimus davidi TaxID=227884 RepID=A0A914R4B5_9BILA
MEKANNVIPPPEWLRHREMSPTSWLYRAPRSDGESEWLRKMPDGQYMKAQWGRRQGYLVKKLKDLSRS